MQRATPKVVSPIKVRLGGSSRASKENSKKIIVKSKVTKTPKLAKGGAVTKEVLLDGYREMLRSRILDQKTVTLYKQNKCHFQIGCGGHEAVQIAIAKNMRPGKDWFYPYYRGLPLCAALGMTDEDFMLMCMNKEEDPTSHGRMMPMHYGHKDLRIVQQSSPTGTQFLQAVGIAHGAKYKGLDEVVFVSSGEGTCSQGDFHEALSWASREKLPVLFLIENNDYAISVHVSEQLGAKSIYDLTSGYENLTRYSIDGTDYAGCYKLAQSVMKDMRAGKGPVLIEAHVPRLQSHSISDDHNKYMTKEQIAEVKSRCPIKRLHDQLVKEKFASTKQLSDLEEQLKDAVNAACDIAESKADCDPSEAEKFNYADADPSTLFAEGTPSGEEIYLVDAINHALDEEMARNSDMVIFGQDVAHGKGGVFTVTTGLTKKYGKKRVFNSPLAESSIAGVAVGLATRGIKPVVEIQFGDYVWTAMMQIRNELAMMYYRSKGDFTCPAVIRIPVGGYIHGGVYHSQNIEGTFSHFPGLFIVYPSNASDAKGLLKAAIRGKDPVLFLEHKGLYRQVYAKGAEGDADCLTPLGKGKVVREGSDLTIVTWGAIVNKSVLAAKTIEEEDGRSVEVIDLRTIVPLDLDIIKTSVAKTGRLLIAHEDTQFMGFGAEIAAQVADSCFNMLDAPIKRVGMKYAACVPHSPVLEAATLPQNEDVLNAAREILSF